MFEFSSIEQYHSGLLEGHITCVQAVEFYLKKIKETKRLNAFIEVYADEALHKAKQLDEKRKKDRSLKKLHGVVVAIKDVLC